MRCGRLNNTDAHAQIFPLFLVSQLSVMLLKGKVQSEMKIFTAHSRTKGSKSGAIICKCSILNQNTN